MPYHMGKSPMATAFQVTGACRHAEMTTGLALISTLERAADHHHQHDGHSATQANLGRAGLRLT